MNSLGRQLTVRVQNAGEGDSVTVQRDEDEVRQEVERQGAAIESIQTTFERPTDFEMTVTASNNKPDPDIPDPPSDRGTVGYLNVEPTADDEAIGEARFNFRVTQDRLDQQGIDRDEVVLMRYSGGEWSVLETTFGGTAPDGSLRFQSVSPDGFSVFAIGARPAQQTTTAEPTTTAPPTTSTVSPAWRSSTTGRSRPRFAAEAPDSSPFSPATTGLTQ